MELSRLKTAWMNLEQLIAVMPGHVYWLDRDNCYQGCNTEQARAFRLKTPEEIVGKRNEDLIEVSIARIWDSNNLAVMEAGKPQIFEEPSQLSSGTTMVLSHKAPLLDNNGRVIGLLGISLDISHWKQREHFLKEKIAASDMPLEHIVSHLPGHVYWKNLKGVYLGCNDRQAKSLGFESGESVIGKTDFDLSWGPQLAAVYRENDLRIMQTGISEIVEEVAYLSGEEMTFLSQKTPLKNKQGDIQGVLGISFDITEQKRLEKALIEAKEAAECANQLKSEFIRNMEHDIRTPFGGILGMTKILEATETDLARKQIMTDIIACAQELLNYSCSILDFSRIQMGTLPLESKRFYLKDLLDSLLHIESLAAQEKGLSFSIEMSPDVPARLIGDEYRLKRILINLLSNAIKFTSQGFVRLSVTLANNAILTFKIEDSGIGIAASKLNLLYESFNRLNPANLGIYKGQGLGLTIVKQFVQEMKGTITIESVLNQGSTFTCSLPFLRDNV